MKVGFIEAMAGQPFQQTKNTLPRRHSPSLPEPRQQWVHLPNDRLLHQYHMWHWQMPAGRATNGSRNGLANTDRLLLRNIYEWGKLFVKNCTFGTVVQIGFAEKSNRPASEQILLATPMDERMMSACVGQNKRWKMWYRQKNLTYLGLTGSWSSNRIFDRPINGWEIRDSVFGQTRCTRLYQQEIWKGINKKILLGHKLTPLTINTWRDVASHKMLPWKCTF